MRHETSLWHVDIYGKEAAVGKPGSLFWLDTKSASALILDFPAFYPSLLWQILQLIQVTFPELKPDQILLLPVEESSTDFRLFCATFMGQKRTDGSGRMGHSSGPEIRMSGLEGRQPGQQSYVDHGDGEPAQFRWLCWRLRGQGSPILVCEESVSHTGDRA